MQGAFEEKMNLLLRNQDQIMKAQRNNVASKEEIKIMIKEVLEKNLKVQSVDIAGESLKS